MKIPKFEVIQTDKGLQLVSDAGHKHYKPAIEMLLASEMFVRNNLYLINFYRYGLAMIENNVIGAVELPSFALFEYDNRFESEKYLEVANSELQELKDNIPVVEMHGGDLGVMIKQLSEIIILVKMAFHNKPQLIRN